MAETHTNQDQGHQESTTGHMAQMAKDAASSASRAASEGVAGGMHSLAGTLRDKAPHGMLGTAAGTVADSIDSGGRYLEQEGFGGMADDLVTLARRYPIASMVICASIGYCLGRMLSSSSSHSGSY